MEGDGEESLLQRAFPNGSPIFFCCEVVAGCPAVIISAQKLNYFNKNFFFLMNFYTHMFFYFSFYFNSQQSSSYSIDSHRPKTYST